MFLAASAVAAELPPGVLVLYPDHHTLPSNIVTDETLRREVPKGLDGQVAIYSEFLDTEQFANESYHAANAQYVHEKYQGRNIKVLVAVAPRGLQFVLSHYDRMLPNIPVVYTVLSKEALREFTLPPNFVGAAADTPDDPSIALALRLHPTAKRVYVVTGASAQDRRWERLARRAEERLKPQVEVIYLSGLPTAEVLQRLRALTKESIVYSHGYFEDGAGVTSIPHEATKQMASVSGAPIYSRIPDRLGYGVVGGYVLTRERLVTQAAGIVVQLLQGVAPAEIKVTPLQGAYMFDARQLRRWNIEESQLPAGSIVKFKTPTLWEGHRPEILITVLLLLLQALFIAALLVERRRRHSAEHEARKRLGEMAHLSRSMALGEISAALAHELNQPLGAILNNAGAAEMLIKSGVPVSHQLNEILADIKRDDQRASDVIARLRAMLRKSEFEIRDVDLNAAVEDVGRFVASEASLRSVALRMQLQPDLPAVRGDRVQLQQVILNLALNGMDAMNAQPAETREIMIRTDRVNDAEAQLSVVDSGVGIPEEKLARIFEPFVTTKTQGMGLGLSISRTIIEAHGGRIWAERAAERGAVLRFTVPLESGASP